jgi:sialate O-acetylesterase
MKDIRWESPVYKSFAIEGPKMRVAFDFAQGLKTRDGKAPTWFELCGPDGLFKPANAAIDGTSVVLSAPGVTAPMAMRFAWDQLAEPNLVNGLGLPAGAFRCGNKPKLDGVMALPELQGFRKVYEIDLPGLRLQNRRPEVHRRRQRRARRLHQVAYTLQLQDDSATSATSSPRWTLHKERQATRHPLCASGICHQTKVTT